MKIRNGFVSNSSSSSFLLFAEKLNSLPSKFEPKILVVDDDTESNDGGVFIYELDKEMYNMAKANINLLHLKGLRFFRDIGSVNEGGKLTFQEIDEKTKNITGERRKNIVVENFTTDINVPYDANELREFYDLMNAEEIAAEKERIKKEREELEKKERAELERLTKKYNK